MSRPGDPWAAQPAFSPVAASAASTRDGRRARTQSVVVGIAGVRQNAAAAVCVDGHLVACCEQERLTRQRRAGLVPSSLPAEAVRAALESAGGFELSDVRRFATTEEAAELPDGLPAVRVDHHRAHAATAFYLSRFPAAAVLVCDRHRADQLSVWTGGPDGLHRHDWPAEGRGPAALFAEAAQVFGLRRGNEHELEALAHLDPQADATRFESIISWQDGRLSVSPAWPEILASWLTRDDGKSVRQRASLASAFQLHLGRLLVQLVERIRAETNANRLCLAGGLFYNTSLTTAIRQSGVFDDVFVPPNPGNAGTSIGAALLVAASQGQQPQAPASPFLGPAFDLEAIKRTLDNCKLSAECLSEREVLERTAAALHSGLLVGWFQGRMEWGHRALGNRSILASPFSPYVLDNLNVFLKHRERHRTYGVSVLEERALEFFDGPPASRWMEYEHRPRDGERFRAILPAGASSLRVQTIPAGPEDKDVARFRELHEQFGRRSGAPVLVNTSFNGFAEPMVCSPRDAIRVFFGSGLDLLVMNRFVISK